MKRGQFILAIFLVLAMGLGSLGSTVSQVAAQTLPPPVKTPGCSIPEGERIHLAGKAGEVIPLHLEAVSATAADCIWAAGKPAEFGSLELQETVNALEATYTPDPGHIGSDEFELLVANPHGLPSLITVLIDVMPARPTQISDPETLVARHEQARAIEHVKPLASGQYLSESNAQITVVTPYIVVHSGDDRIEGLNWTTGAAFTVTIGSNSWSGTVGNDGRFDIYTTGFDITGGTAITVTDGSSSLTYTVDLLHVTSVDTTTNIVQGIALTGATVHNVVYSPVWFVHPDIVIADTEDKWSIDFTGQLDLVQGMYGQAYIDHASGNRTAYDWHLLKPTMDVSLTYNEVYANDWEPDSYITLTIGSSSWQKKADSNGWVWFPVDSKIEPGTEVAMTDGINPISHIVRDLKVLSFNPDTDVVSGTAEPGSVEVLACLDGGSSCEFLPIDPIVGSDLSWSANFTGLVDLEPGSTGFVRQYDENQNYTSVYWHVPKPRMEVAVTYNSINVYDFPASSRVYLYIDGVYMDRGTSNSNGYVYFYLYDFDVKAGQTVTLTSGSVSLSYVVQSITVDNQDVASNIVSGKGDANKRVNVYACTTGTCTWDNGGVYADAQGNWSYDFTGLVDIVKTSTGRAYQEDANGNITWYSWFVPNPVMEAYPMWDQVSAYLFKPGGEVTLSIGSLTWKAVADEDGWLNINTTGHDLVAGDKIFMTQGDLAIDHTVIDLQVTNIDVINDVVSGKAQTEIICELWGYDDNYWETTVMPGLDGSWTADLTSFVDVNPGSYGYVSQSDYEGDSTIIRWNVSNPSFVVYPQDDAISVYEWPANDKLKITIGNRTWDLTADVDGWAYLELEGFDIKPGQVVTVTDGTITKAHTVVDLYVTEIDLENDLVIGHGGPNSSVFVAAFQPDGHIGYGIRPETNANGNWVADFSNMIDLIPGGWGWAEQEDDDGDITHVEYTIEAKLFLPMILR